MRSRAEIANKPALRLQLRWRDYPLGRSSPHRPSYSPFQRILFHPPYLPSPWILPLPRRGPACLRVPLAQLRQWGALVGGIRREEVGTGQGTGKLGRVQEEGAGLVLLARSQDLDEARRSTRC